MDVIKEMQEMRAMKAQVEELAKQGMDPKGLSQKLHLPKKEGESDLSWKTRVLTLSYASDFIDGAEAKDIQLTFQPEEAEAVAQAVGAAYEYNLVNREVGHKAGLLLSADPVPRTGGEAGGQDRSRHSCHRPDLSAGQRHGTDGEPAQISGGEPHRGGQ